MKIRTTTVKASAIKYHRCIGCGHIYSYDVAIDSTYSTTISSGINKPPTPTPESIGKTLLAKIKIVPCPKCGLYQPEMVRKLRFEGFEAPVFGPIFFLVIYLLSHYYLLWPKIVTWFWILTLLGSAFMLSKDINISPNKRYQGRKFSNKMIPGNEGVFTPVKCVFYISILLLMILACYIGWTNYYCPYKMSTTEYAQSFYPSSFSAGERVAVSQWVFNKRFVSTYNGLYSVDPVFTFIDLEENEYPAQVDNASDPALLKRYRIEIPPVPERNWVDLVENESDIMKKVSGQTVEPKILIRIPEELTPSSKVRLSMEWTITYPIVKRGERAYEKNVLEKDIDLYIAGRGTAEKYFSSRRRLLVFIISATLLWIISGLLFMKSYNYKKFPSSEIRQPKGR